MDADLKVKIHRLWRRFLLMGTPDAEYFAAIQQAHQAGEEAKEMLIRFQHELDNVTLRIEKKQ